MFRPSQAVSESVLMGSFRFVYLSESKYKSSTDLLSFAEFLSELESLSCSVYGV